MKRKLLARYRFAFFWVLSALIFLAGVVGAGAWYYRNQKRICEPRCGKTCNAVADLKTAEIAEWRRSRLREAHLLGDDARLAPSVELLLRQKTEGKQAAASILEPFRRHTQFDRIAVLDPEGEDPLVGSAVLWQGNAP